MSGANIDFILESSKLESLKSLSCCIHLIDVQYARSCVRSGGMNKVSFVLMELNFTESPLKILI